MIKRSYHTHLSIVVDDAVSVALLLNVELLLFVVHQIGLVSADQPAVLGNVPGGSVVDVV